MLNRLRDLREDNDLTQTEFAKILHISQTNYSKYELGKINIPNTTLIQIAKYYNVSLDSILGLIPRPRPLYEKSTHRRMKDNLLK